MKAIEQAHTSTAIAESESEMSRTGALKEQIERAGVEPRRIVGTNRESEGRPPCDH